MTRPANVLSIEVLRTFQHRLQEYESRVRDLLTALTLETQRGVSWVEQDRTAYWPRQVRKADENVVAARNALERCELIHKSTPRKSCIDEKKALEKAKRRLRYAEKQIKVVRHWLYVVRHEAEELRGKAYQLEQFLDVDLQRAIAALDRMASALENYTRVTPSAGGQGTAREVASTPDRSEIEDVGLDVQRERSGEESP